MKVDPGLDLVWVAGAVRKGRIDLRARDDAVGGELGGRVLDRPEVVDPHRDLPNVRSTDQPCAPAGRAVAERDHRVLVAAGALFGVATKAIGQALASGTGAEAEPFGESVVEAD